MAEAERPAPDPLAGLAIGLAVNAAVQSTVTGARQGAALSDCLARLKRVERRVDALVHDCDARFEAVAARLDALPAAATADPLAVPPAVTASRSRGNAGESAGEARTDDAPATRGQGRPRPGPTQVPRTSRGQGAAGEQAAAQRPRDNAPRDHRRAPPDAQADHSGQNRPSNTSPLQPPAAWGEAVAQAVNDLLAQTQRRGNRGEAAAQRGAGQGARASGRPGEVATPRTGQRSDRPAQPRGGAHATEQLARALGTGLRSGIDVGTGIGQTLNRALDPRPQARHAVNVAAAVPQAAVTGAVTGAVALAQQLGALGAWFAETAQPARHTNPQLAARHTRAQNTHRPAPSTQAEHSPSDRQNAESPARPTPRAPSRLLGGQGERAASSPPGGSSTTGQHRPPVAAPERVSAQPADTDPLEALNRQLIDQAWLRGVDLR